MSMQFLSSQKYLTKGFTKFSNYFSKSKLLFCSLALLFGSSMSYAQDNQANETTNSNGNTIVAPQGANHSLSPIVSQTNTNVTYTLKDILITLHKTYQIQTSDYNQQLFFTHANPQSILVIQSLYENNAEKINYFIPTALTKDSEKITKMVTQDLNNVLKNFLLSSNLNLSLLPLTTKLDRNILTYSGELITYRNTSSQGATPNPQEMKFGVSGAELFYGNTLYLIFSMSPKQPVPFNNSAILNQNIQAVLSQLKLVPLTNSSAK